MLFTCIFLGACESDDDINPDGAKDVIEMVLESPDEIKLKGTKADEEIYLVALRVYKREAGTTDEYVQTNVCFATTEGKILNAKLAKDATKELKIEYSLLKYDDELTLKSSEITEPFNRSEGVGYPTSAWGIFQDAAYTDFPNFYSGVAAVYDNVNDVYVKEYYSRWLRHSGVVADVAGDVSTITLTAQAGYFIINYQALNPDNERLSELESAEVYLSVKNAPENKSHKDVITLAQIKQGIPKRYNISDISSDAPEDVVLNMKYNFTDGSSAESSMDISVKRRTRYTMKFYFRNQMGIILDGSEDFDDGGNEYIDV